MRLELTTRTNLAIGAIRHLAENDHRVARSELAQLLETTPDFLARVMAPLVHSGWVASGTGPGGGYALTESGRTVSVFDVITAVEGVPEEDACVLRSGPCRRDDRCALHDAWTRARTALMTELRQSPVLQNGKVR